MSGQEERSGGLVETQVTIRILGTRNKVMLFIVAALQKCLYGAG